VSDERVEIAEGCRWDGGTQRLLWVDVFTGRLYVASFDGRRLTTTVVLKVPGHLTAVAPFQDREEGWIVAANQGFSRLSPSGETTPLGDPEARNAGAVRMNDGACDPAGRFWAGSMAYDGSPGAGSLYRYDGGGRWTTMLTGVTISNGIGWSPDAQRMYYVDSGAGTVSVLAYNVETGEATHRRPLITLDPGQGIPDGLCVDRDGHLWVAIWGAGEVRRYSPEGIQVAVVEVAANQPTCCALGGPDGRSLFITTAQIDLSGEDLAKQPQAGRVFACRVETPGPPVQVFIPNPTTELVAEQPK
jgi:sugar lactone lactonase YvrE